MKNIFKKKATVIITAFALMLTLIPAAGFAAPAGPQIIPTATIEGIDIPAPGDLPDQDYTVPAGAHYDRYPGNIAMWFEIDPAKPDQPVYMNPDEGKTFEPDTEYLLYVCLQSDAGYIFDDNETAVPAIPGSTVKASDVLKYPNTNNSTLDINYVFYVEEPAPEDEFKLSIDPESLDFGALKAGYAVPEAKTFTVTNTGNYALDIAPLKEMKYFDVKLLTETANNSLQPEKSLQFSIQPKKGLGAGEYTEKIDVGSSGVSPYALRDPADQEEPEYLTKVTLTASFSVEEEAATAPVQPSDNDKTTPDKDASAPQTGDSSHILPWLFLMAAALIVILAVLFTSKKRHSHH